MLRPVRPALLLLLAGSMAPASAAGGSTPTADRPAGEAVRLTWPDLVRLVDADPRVDESRERIDAARGSLRAAGGVPNPSVTATLARGDALDGPGERLEWALELSVPLSWLALRGPRVEAAAAGVDAARAEAALTRMRVLAELDALFWGLAHDQALVAELDQAQQESEALAAAVTRRVESGEARPIEQLKVEIDVDEGRGALDSARAALRARTDKLALWLGDTDRRFVIDADLQGLPPVPDLAAVRRRLHDAHPARDVAEAQARGLAAVVQVERRARLPEIEVVAFTETELDRRSVGAGVGVELPLWNWNAGAVSRAEAELRAAVRREQAELRGLEAELIESHADCAAASSVAARYEQRILPRAQMSASLATKAYELGEADLLELMDTRRVFTATRRGRLDALAKAQLACSRLALLAGMEEQ